jgi:tRNA(Ile)-lysidine synthase
MKLEAQFKEEFRSLGVRRCCLLVAVSGGPDSVALLHLLAEVAPEFGLTLVVAHVDHGISSESRAVAAGVAALAARLGLQCIERQLHLGASATETTARTARWQALRQMQHAASAARIVTAHHLDDQAETVMMRVLRGTGPAGLAGMSAQDGDVLRPLLSFRPEEPAQYLQLRGLGAWLDPANRDPRHDRAWIRNELIPLLQRRWPRVSQDLAGVGGDAGRWRAAWDDALDKLGGLDLRSEPDGISVAGGVLAGYSSAMGWAVVRAAARRAGATVSGASAERVMELARSGVSGRWVPLGDSWRASNAFGRVRIEQVVAAPERVAVTPASGTVSWGEWTFTLSHEMAPGRQERRGLTAWFPPGALAIRSPAAGDRMQPLGGPGHRAVVRLLQDEKVPLSRRRVWPLLELAGKPTWMPGICRSQSGLPEPGTEALRIDAVHS